MFIVAAGIALSGGAAEAEGSGPVMVLNRLPVQPEYAAQFEEAFAEALPTMRDVPGFIRSWVLRPENPAEGEYIAMTLWESEAAFRAWTQSEAFRRGHQMSLPREAYRGRNIVEIYQVASDTQ